MEANDAWILRGVQTQPTGGLHAQFHAQQNGSVPPARWACAIATSVLMLTACSTGMEPVTEPALGPQQIQAAPAERDIVNVA